MGTAILDRPETGADTGLPGNGLHGQAWITAAGGAGVYLPVEREQIDWLSITAGPLATREIPDGTLYLPADMDGFPCPPTPVPDGGRWSSSAELYAGEGPAATVDVLVDGGGYATVKIEQEVFVMEVFTMGGYAAVAWPIQGALRRVYGVRPVPAGQVPGGRSGVGLLWVLPGA